MDPRDVNPADLTHAVLRLREGRLVAIPTETVYGLAADARNPAAVRRVFELKQRPPHNPLIVHVADASMARPFVAAWPREADALARRFWPGPLTIVLPRSLNVHDLITAGGPTVAIRCPDHILALALLRAFNGPLVAPSANPSGAVSPTRAEHVAASFSSDDVLVLDGGPCRVGIESTVLSLAEDPPRILRLGAISVRDIEHVIQRPVRADTPPAASPDQPLPSPGLLDRHYAPRAPLKLLTSDDSSRVPSGSTLITHRGARYTSIAAHIIGMPADPDSYAARLYDALREADATNPPAIFLDLPREQGPLWDAIRDRLSRAASRA